MRDGYALAAGAFGLVIGAWVGNRLGFGHGGFGLGCGGYGGFGPGYYGGDRPCHEDKQDDKIAYLMAESAANKVAIKKDEKIAYLEDKVLKGELKGDIFRATCHKPDGEVYLSPRHLANSYRGESRVLDSHPVGFEGRGFRNDDCCGNDWY